MFFPGRDVSEYAQHVCADELVVGNVYFLIHYHDEQLLIPTVEPVVFLGKNISGRPEQGSGDVFVFQDYPSYRNGMPYHPYAESDSESDGESADGLRRAVFQDGPEQMLSMVFDFDHALESLLGCSIRRAGSVRAAGGQS